MIDRQTRTRSLITLRVCKIIMTVIVIIIGGTLPPPTSFDDFE